MLILLIMVKLLDRLFHDSTAADKTRDYQLYDITWV